MGLQISLITSCLMAASDDLVSSLCLPWIHFYVIIIVAALVWYSVSIAL